MQGQPATSLVMVDEAGRMVEVLYAPSLSGVPRRYRPPDGQEYSPYLDPAKVGNVVNCH